MIKSFKHKELKNFFCKNDVSGINPQQLIRIQDILTILNISTKIQQINYPGLKLHKLKGDLKDNWSIMVSGNYRITFKFEDENVYDVDYVDYH